MLRFIRRRPYRRQLEPYRAQLSVADINPDLRIRDLCDDPRLRRALGIDIEGEPPVRPLETAA